MRRLIALPLLLWMTACGPVFFVEAELPRICKTFGGQSFPGVPVNPLGSDTFTFPPLSFDFGTQLTDLTQQGLETELRITQMQLMAAGSMSDLDFLRGISVTLLPPVGSSLAPLPVVDYVRDANAASSATIDLGQIDLMDIFDYISSGTFDAEMTFTGSLPTSNWTMDVKPCLYVRGKYQYL